MSGQRVVVCDYDELTRSTTARVVADAGFDVIAETDEAMDAVALVERFGANIVITDLALKVGTGDDVIRGVANQRTAASVVVFSTFADQVPVAGPVAASVAKPDFEGLRRVLARLELTPNAPADRRAPSDSPNAVTRAASTVDDPAPDFYQALAEAQPGDSLVIVEPADTASLPSLATLVRATVRPQDWLLIQSSRLVVLLIGGHSRAAQSVTARLAPIVPGCALQAAAIGDSHPSDTFARLTARPR